MRFIIILALFAVTAYASSDGNCKFEKAELPKGGFLKEFIEDPPKGIAYNFENKEAGCTLTACLNYCYSVMNPPFFYTCCGDCCACIKA